MTASDTKRVTEKRIGIEKEIVDLLREIAPIMRREHDNADGYFSTKQVERIEALLQRMGKI